MSLLILAASARAGSFNYMLANMVANEIVRSLQVPFVLKTVREYDFPGYDGDLENQGMPKSAENFAQDVQTSQAVLIVTPEYNGGIPGTLKNAIDWSSRLKPNPWFRKPVFLSGATPGALAAVRGLLHTRVPLESLGADVFPETFGMAKANEAFDEAGKLKDPKSLERLQGLVREFLTASGLIINRL